MAGRPITNHSTQARRKRERTQQLREARKERPATFNPQPLARAVANWSKTWK